MPTVALQGRISFTVIDWLHLLQNMCYGGLTDNKWHHNQQLQQKEWMEEERKNWSNDFIRGVLSPYKFVVGRWDSRLFSSTIMLIWTRLDCTPGVLIDFQWISYVLNSLVPRMVKRARDMRMTRSNCLSHA